MVRDGVSYWVSVMMINPFVPGPSLCNRELSLALPPPPTLMPVAGP
jgi:hypothetical protein